jgi:hypothetical protein
MVDGVVEKHGTTAYRSPNLKPEAVSPLYDIRLGNDSKTTFPPLDSSFLQESTKRSGSAIKRRSLANEPG